MCISKQRGIAIQSLDMSTMQQKPSQRPKRSSKSGKRRDQFIVVQHHYHDHAQDQATSEEKLILDSAQQNPLVASFPMKLFMMLEQVEADGNAHIVSWQAHGRCFAVHEPELFKELLPRYFSLSKVSSFQRQLNLYDFTRLTRGKDKGGYYNEFFLRSRPHLLNKIQRIKVKGTGVRARSNPEQEPDFWTMPAVGAVDSVTSQMNSMSASVVSEDDHTDCPAPVYSELSMQEDYESMSHPLSAELPTDVQLCGWGMPFYYLDSLPGQTSADECKSSSAEPSTEFLNSVDMDNFIDSVVDVDNDMSFSNLLEKIVD